MDVLAVAARRDMVVALLEAVRGAGLQPVGIDLSAFGMIRALRRSLGARAGESGEMPLPTDALLPPRRRHQPRGRPRQ